MNSDEHERKNYRWNKGFNRKPYNKHGRQGKYDRRDHFGNKPRGPRDQRFGKASRPVAREVVLREGEIEPKPNGLKCNPLCPYFRCGKRALRINKEGFGRDMKFVGFCMWVGDLCIGAVCQYAYCEKRYILPDGRCLYAVEKTRKGRSMDDMFKEIEKEEMMADKFKRTINRKYGDISYD